MSTTPTRTTKSQAGFSMVELMVASTLGSMLMVGVMTSFLFINRTSYSAMCYAEMETATRAALEYLTIDVRQATVVTWNSSTSITLTVPYSYTGTANKVTFAYDDPSANTDTAGCFYLRPGDSSSTAAKQVLVKDVIAFTFNRYNRLNAAASSDGETKRIQMSMVVQRGIANTINVTNKILSASFVIRNKPVS